MIDVETAKAHLRVENTDEDGLVAAYLAAATALVEAASSKCLTPTEIVQPATGFPSNDRPIRLWKGPVDADTAALEVVFDDSDGTEQVLADFRLVEGSNGKLLPAYGASWPASQPSEGSVRIAYTAGYAADAVPPALAQAVLLLTAHFYANREAAIASDRAAAVELPLGVEALIAPFRAPGIS